MENYFYKYTHHHAITFLNFKHSFNIFEVCINWNKFSELFQLQCLHTLHWLVHFKSIFNLRIL